MQNQKAFVSDGRKFEQEVLRSHEEFDLIEAEDFCVKRFPINIDEKLIKQAKLMLRHDSTFRVKYEALNRLLKSPLFVFTEAYETEIEKQLRNEKKGKVTYYQKLLENPIPQINIGWIKVSFKQLENELQHPMRFLIKTLQKIKRMLQFWTNRLSMDENLHHYWHFFSCGMYQNLSKIKTRKTIILVFMH